ncbi:MAG: YajQ family cyclic di-GMP-binding protein [Actinobacteria bacterium]|nr:YajQ family cyclic di-GMP-binding protein [Actinomycetota bacterium]
MADSSFDIVSKVDRQETDNALNQAAKEIQQRYDFKGTDAEISWSGESILIKANSEERAKAALDVFQTKLIKRGISLKSLDSSEPQPSGKEFRITSTMKNGIDQENAKKISKIIRDEGPKSVKSQIQGDELRVSSKSRDDLQQLIALLRGKDLDVDLQFVNYRYREPRNRRRLQSTQLPPASGSETLLLRLRSQSHLRHRPQLLDPLGQRR